MNILLLFSFSYQGRLKAPKRVMGDSAASVRKIPVKFYSSEAYVKYLTKHGKSLNSMINDVIASTQIAINNGTVKHPKSTRVEFKPIFEYDLPVGVNLDECGVSESSFGNILNSFYQEDPETPTVAILNCSSDAYEETFSKLGINIPNVSHNINFNCSKRILTFVEVELPNFMASITAALLKIAGVKDENPVKFEEIDGGDSGIRYDMKISNSAIKEIAEAECYRHRL